MSDITNTGERIFLLIYDTRNSYENLKSLHYTNISKPLQLLTLYQKDYYQLPKQLYTVHHAYIYKSCTRYVTINNKFARRMMDNAAAPAHLKIICCDCKKSDNLCGSDRCSFMKNRMKYVATFRGLGCQNEQHFIREEEHHLDNAMFE